MPEGTKVDSLYKKLREEGKSEESAARIAQSVTGESLMTGKPAKHENIYSSAEFLIAQITEGRKAFKEGKTIKNNPYPENSEKGVSWKAGWNDAFVGKDYKQIQNSAFERGRQRALNAIGMESCMKWPDVDLTRDSRWEELHGVLQNKNTGDTVMFAGAKYRVGFVIGDQALLVPVK